MLPGARLQFGTKRFLPGTTVDQLLLSPDEKTIVSLGAVQIVWDAHTVTGIVETTYYEWQP